MDEKAAKYLIQVNLLISYISNVRVNGQILSATKRVIAKLSPRDGCQLLPIVKNWSLVQLDFKVKNRGATSFLKSNTANPIKCINNI